MIDIWVVYDHPSDWPEWFVARRWIGETPTEDVMMSHDLDTLRGTLARQGLTRLLRNECDDPVIVEIWL